MATDPRATEPMVEDPTREEREETIVTRSAVADPVSGAADVVREWAACR